MAPVVKFCEGGGLSLDITYRHLVLLSCVGLLVCSYTDALVGGARYIKYAAPLFVLVPWALSCAKGVQPGFCQDGAIAPFILLFVSGAISLIFNYEVEGLKDFYFILIYVVPFILFDFGKEERIARAGVLGVALIYCIKLVLMPKDQFSILNSTGVLEGTEAFVFGAACIYFVQRRWWGLAVFMAILILLSLKRIVLLGVFLGLFAIICEPISRRINLFFIRALIVAGTLLVVLVTYVFSQGYLDSFIAINFGLSANQISMGRFNIYEYVIQGLGYDWGRLMWGTGLGSTYEWVSYATYGGDKNLHNDFLKIFIELGVVVYVLFFFLFARSVSIRSLPLSLFFLTICSTDNVLVYPQVMFFLLLLHQNIRAGEKV